MTLRQLEYFTAVVDQGGFTRAAESLSVSQPGLSHQLRALEDRLGGPLLDRSAGRITLTPLGRATIDHARAALDASRAIERAAARVHDGVAGTVAVGAVTSVSLGLLPGVVQAWLSGHRGRVVDVDEHRHLEPLAASVIAGRNDVGVGPLPAGWRGPSWEIGVEEFVVAVNARHPLAARPASRVTIAELADEPWVQYAEHHGLSGVVDSSCAAAGFAPTVATRTEQTAAVAAYAAAGVGVALVVSNAIGLDFPGVVLRPDPPIPRRIHAFTRAQPDALSAGFVEQLRTHAVLIPPHVRDCCGAGTEPAPDRG